MFSLFYWCHHYIRVFLCYVIILVYYLLCKYLCRDIFIYSACYLLIPFVYCNLQEIENWDKLIIISIRIWYDLFFYISFSNILYLLYHFSM